MAKQPAFFIPHGGGPSFFMDDPQGIWTGMRDFLASLSTRLPEKPSAILLVSAHWETAGFALTGAAKPDLIYDYYGFPEHTYQLQYPAVGAPDIASLAATLIENAGVPVRVDTERGFDHGVFIPLKVAFPGADIPVVAMSVEHGLDPALHLAAGRALAPLRDQGVVIIASGMSFHNLRAFKQTAMALPSTEFDKWLVGVATLPHAARAVSLEQWAKAPFAQIAHPEAEHLLPLMVAAGASDQPGQHIFRDVLFSSAVSAFQFN